MNHKCLPNIIWKSNVVFGMKIKKSVQVYKVNKKKNQPRIDLSFNLPAIAVQAPKKEKWGNEIKIEEDKRRIA